MPINSRHMGRYVYHFSHIDNLPGLLKSGLLANNHPDFPKKSHRSIASAEIQERRAKMPVPCGPGGYVHDYVPLYFGSRSPMLLGVINAKNVDQMEILYFEFPITLVTGPDAVFTDASANTITPPNFSNDPADLDRLNWAAIDSLKWNEPDDVTRHQRMAELLIHRQLPLAAASRCVVWNEAIKTRVQQIVAKAAVAFPPIEFESPSRRHWFTNIGEGTTLVIGPREAASLYEYACELITKERGKNAKTAPFANLEELLAGLRSNFGCLPHTAELIGLKSANAVHRETVDIHTQEVVQKLFSLDEYTKLSDREKLLVELAAYLHDIGKGPRSRWDNNNGLQKNDPNHPIGALPMMFDILTNYVGNVTQADAETLTKLVCYHDLVGDVLGRGRDEEQIAAVAGDQGELDMLFALGRADATTLVPWWWNWTEANALHKRCLAAIGRKG